MAELKSANSARPGSLGSPVPGNDAQAKADAFFAESKPAALPQDSAQQAADQYFSSQDSTPLPPEAGGPGAVAQASMQAAGQALDYPGGIIRTGLAGAAGAITGNPNVVTPEDLTAAAKGKAPSSAEYLKRLGVSEGGSLNLPVLGRVTTRGAEGLALDVLTDPLTALSKLIKEAPYIGKLINAPNKASEAIGEQIYKSAFTKVDANLAKKGIAPISESLIEAGAPVGGEAKIAQKVNDMSQTLGKIRQGLYDKATEKGVLIDTAYPLNRAEAVIENMRKDPGLAPAADSLQELLSRYKQAGKVPIDVVSEWKTNLYDSLPASAFDQFGQLKNRAKAFKSALAADFRERIVQAGNAAEDGLGDSINKLNEKWGTLLSAQQPLAKAQQAVGGKLGHIIDGAVLATGGLKGAAIKKTYDFATSPYMKTLIGKALIEAGKTGTAGAFARRALIDHVQQTQSQIIPPLSVAPDASTDESGQ